MLQLSSDAILLSLINEEGVVETVWGVGGTERKRPVRHELLAVALLK